MQDRTAPESMRLFYALWPDDATRESLARLQSGLGGRLTAYGNLHVTLAFLGEQPVAQLPALRSILHALPGADMTLAIDRLGYFARNRIAWAGMHAPPPELQRLHQALVAALRDQGIAFDARSRFKPHITLARDAAPVEDAVFEPIHWTAQEVALVESDMHSRGVSYRVVESRRLGG